MRPLIAANWKMHGDMSWAGKPGQFNALMPASERQDIDVLICPPFPMLAALKNSHNILVGAQNCHAETSGAHTGEVSADMIKSAGAGYVILGHSERRAAGETDAQVKAKAKAAIAAGLMPIICVGESLDMREAGQEKDIVSAQLAASVPETHAGIVIAYEPIWAIGTGKTASNADIADMHGHIREIVGGNTRILYGGSVKPANAQGILSTANVNGALIGGASLEMESLAQIAKAAQ